MANYSVLRDWVSKRVRIEYDTGAYIVGYLATTRPADGPVQLIKLEHAQMHDSSGVSMGEIPDELWLCPNVLTGLRREEGPSGRDQ